MKLLLSLLLIGSTTLAWSIPQSRKIDLLKNPNGKKTTLKKKDIVSLERFENMFSMDSRTPGLQAMLKRHSFNHKQKAVPTLIKVMKESKYPVQNRWHATMLLAQIMGNKAAPFIAKFSEHPHWMMRVASLKALLGLKQTEYLAVYKKSLKDPSHIVRIQALDNIAKMNIKKLAPDVWSMLYDQSNYTGVKGALKRTSIVKSIIRTIGDVKYDSAAKPMAILIQKPKYNDLVDDLDYSLAKITGENSPRKIDEKRKFWSTRVVLRDKKI